MPSSILTYRGCCLRVSHALSQGTGKNGHFQRQWSDEVPRRTMTGPTEHPSRQGSLALGHHPAQTDAPMNKRPRRGSQRLQYRPQTSSGARRPSRSSPPRQERSLATPPPDRTPVRPDLAAHHDKHSECEEDNGADSIKDRVCGGVGHFIDRVLPTIIAPRQSLAGSIDPRGGVRFSTERSCSNAAAFEQKKCTRTVERTIMKSRNRPRFFT